MTLCHENGAKLIEDAAHAFGATYQGRHVGQISDFTAFSFQAIKQLTTIDGGCLACLNPEDFRRGKLLRWYGIDREQKRGDFRCEADIVEAGTKAHMNDVCATIGIEQMKYLPSILSQHQDNALYYDGELRRAGIKTVQPLRYKYDRFSTHWLYTVRALSRDRFVKWMNDNGIQTSRVHQRNDIHTYAREFKADLPGVDEFNAFQANVPVGWWLSGDNKNYIINKIKEWENVCL
jgi:dTDP-4-amino-4,6-dideoxygalactose transaminase